MVLGSGSDESSISVENSFIVTLTVRLGHLLFFWRRDSWWRRADSLQKDRPHALQMFHSNVVTSMKHRSFWRCSGTTQKEILSKCFCKFGRRMDRRMDGRTDTMTDRPSYRDAFLPVASKNQGKHRNSRCRIHILYVYTHEHTQTHTPTDKDKHFF